MDISIVILNYKTKGLLKQQLRALAPEILDLSCEIIVVDNASADSSVTMVQESFPRVSLIASSKNLGFAGGINLGLRKTRGEYILILNPDVAIIPSSIKVMYNFMEEHSRAGIVGPRLINPDGSIQTSCRRFPGPAVIIYRRTPFGKLPFARKKLRSFLMSDWDHNTVRPVDWMIGACYLIRKQALDEVGLMDERFFLYFEDVDFCRRFWEKNWEVWYLPEAEMVHYHQRQSAENPGLQGIFSYPTRIHIQSGLRYFTKYFRVPLPRKE